MLRDTTDWACTGARRTGHPRRDATIPCVRRNKIPGIGTRGVGLFDSDLRVLRTVPWPRPAMRVRWLAVDCRFFLAGSRFRPGWPFTSMQPILRWRSRAWFLSPPDYLRCADQNILA